MEENKIFICSDLHFCHNKNFIYEPRGFKSVYEMNEAIVKNWNSVIGPNDTVYLLGDIMLNDNFTGLELLKQLKGNIYIALGNHDTDSRAELYKGCWNVKDVQMCYRINYKKNSIIMSHYPQLTSNPGDKHPVISLAGHTHTPDKWADWGKGMIYHVELDAHNNTPVLLDDILEDIKGKIV